MDNVGYTWYINHSISAVVLMVTFSWACKQALTGHIDKFLHYFVSVGITLLFIILLPVLHIAWCWSPIITITIGAVKEGYDYLNPKTHTCDVKDFIADALGVLAMTTLYLFSFVMVK